jgi:hypothetical protein
MPKIRGAAAGVLCLLVVSLGSRMIRQASAQSGGRATPIGVQRTAFTIKGLDLSSKAIASTVITDLTRGASCYGEDGGFVLVETDPEVLAIRKAEIDLSNSPGADPSTRMTNRYVAPSRSVTGSWSSDGTSVTVTLRVVDAQGRELQSSSATGPLSQLLDMNSRVASALAAALCAPQAEVRLTYAGMWGPYADARAGACPGVDRRGTDVIEGVVRLSASERELDGDVAYFGVLKRQTHVGVCDLKPRNGHEDENDYCAMNLSGSADVEVEIAVSAGGDGASVMVKPVPGSGSASVTGNCTPKSQSEERAAYPRAEGFPIGEAPAGRLRVGRYAQYKEGLRGNSAGEWVLEVLRVVASTAQGRK